MIAAAWLVAAGTLSRAAFAGESVESLSERLVSNSDFRIRTQAALALGASNEKKAVDPLCKGLEDVNTTVRAAAAAALGKLALGGKKCLTSRLKQEENTSVKSVIEKAISRVEAGPSTQGGGGSLNAQTKYYVAIAETIDKTGRKKGKVDTIVHEAMVSSAGSADGYAVAPNKETSGEAQKVLGKFKKLKAFYLWPKVSAPEYTGGNLTIKFEISIFTYPGKSLKGTIPLKLTMPDVQRGDVESEDELIKMAASKAFEKFTENADKIE